MKERHKVLAAMHALPEFTAGGLASYADVKPATARSVLVRETRFVEEVGRQETGRRGGQPIVYRVREDARDELRHLLEEEFQSARKLSSTLERAEPVMDDASVELLVALETLTGRYPSATDPQERSRLLADARECLREARIDARDGPQARIAETMRELAALYELDIDTHESGALLGSLGEFDAQLTKVERLLDELEDVDATSEIGGEIRRSLPAALYRDLRRILIYVPHVLRASIGAVAARFAEKRRVAFLLVDGISDQEEDWVTPWVETQLDLCGYGDVPKLELDKQDPAVLIPKAHPSSCILTVRHSPDPYLRLKGLLPEKSTILVFDAQPTPELEARVKAEGGAYFCRPVPTEQFRETLSRAARVSKP